MAQINIRIDDNLKTQSEMLLENLGLNFSTAFNIFLRQAVREGGIPFVVTTRSEDPFYSITNMKVLQESIQAADKGKLTAHELIVDERC
jgi:DNA-damage-inducible protein J